MASKPRHLLIDELVAAATPLPRQLTVEIRAWRWLLLAVAVVVLALCITGPVRDGALSALLNVPRYLLEALLGVGTIISLSLTAFRSAIPSATPVTRQLILPLGLLALWIALCGFGVIDSALPSSMLGKRAHCLIEIFVLGALCWAAGCYGLRHLWPLQPAWSGALLGLAAGAIPAVVMQFMCMYAPLHTLLFHILPAIALGVAGGVAGRFTLRK